MFVNVFSGSDFAPAHRNEAELRFYHMTRSHGPWVRANQWPLLIQTDFTRLKESIASLFIWRWHPTSVYTPACAIYKCFTTTRFIILTRLCGDFCKERLYRKCFLFLLFGDLNYKNIKCLSVPSSSSNYENRPKQSRCLNIPSGKRKRKRVFLIFQLNCSLCFFGNWY